MSDFDKSGQHSYEVGADIATPSQNRISADDWKIAEVLAQPQALFILWAVDDGCFTRPDDLQRHYGDELPVGELISRLEKQGFIELNDGIIKLRQPAHDAISILDEESTADRLSTAIAELTKSANDARVHAALTRWRERIGQTARQVGALLQADVRQGASGRLRPFPRTKQPGLQLHPAFETKGEPGLDTIEDSALVTADAISDCEVAVDSNSISVTFFDASQGVPIVVLIPEDDQDSPRFADPSPTPISGAYEARFESVRSGEYLLAIQPAEITALSAEAERKAQTLPTMIQRFKDLLASTIGELLMQIGRAAVPATMDAQPTSERDYEAIGRVHISRIAPYLRSQLCGLPAIQQMISAPRTLQTAENLATLKSILEELETDIDEDILAAYLIRTEFHGICEADWSADDER